MALKQKNNKPVLETDEEINRLSKIKDLKNENKKLNKRKKELKEELEKKDKEIKRLTALNDNLQNCLIEKCHEQEGIGSFTFFDIK